MPTRKVRTFHRAVSEKSRSPDKSSRISQALQRIEGLENEMARVIYDMQEKVRQLECLNEFSSLINSTLNIEIVREKTLETVCRLLGCETSDLLLVDLKKAELHWEQDKRRVPIDDRSIPGYVAMTGESILTNDLENYLQSHSRSDLGILGPGQLKIHTLICVPLKSKGRITGVIQAINKLPAAPKRPSQHSWPDFHDQDRKLLETLSNEAAIAIENSQLYSEIKKIFFETVESLAEAIEKKDHYTGGHTKRVVYYSMCIAKYLNLSPEQLERVRLGAVLHDVGKIGIEDKILKKQAPLDPEEWKVMQTHPELGFDIMGRVEGLKDVMGGMRYHHERWDGKGYPLGLKGEEIPLIARIISVADTYDAMVSTRPYRKGMDPKVAFEEIIRYRGTQFDPLVVDAFIEAFKKEKMGKGSGGSIFGTSEKGQLSNCD